MGSVHKLTIKGGAVWTVKVRRPAAALRRQLSRWLTDRAGRSQVLEISELKHRITFELVSSEPAVPYASSVSKISLRPVTVTDTTYIGECCIALPVRGDRLTCTRWLCAEWETTYSSDATDSVLTESASQMLEAFKDLDSSLGAGGSALGVDASAIGAGVGAAAEWAFTNTGSSPTLLDIRGPREMVST